MDPKTAAELRLTTFAEVTGAWAVQDPDVAAAFQDLHIGTEAFLEKRLKWRHGQPLTVVEIRAWRLAAPAVVEPKPEHLGCFSWIDLELGDAPLPQRPAIPDDEFKRQQRKLREILGGFAEGPVDLMR